VLGDGRPERETYAALNLHEYTVPEWVGRQNDIAGPLLQIALIAGREWLHRLIAALRIAFKGGEEAKESLGSLLLSDIRDCFYEQQADRVSSADLLEHLRGLEDRPWGDMGYGKPMTPRRLADELRNYGIKVEKIRVGNSTSRGYMRGQFEDPWLRFCSPKDEPGIRTIEIEP
jgi:hypothetical protein